MIRYLTKNEMSILFWKRKHVSMSLFGKNKQNKTVRVEKDWFFPPTLLISNLVGSYAPVVRFCVCARRARR